MKTRLKVSVLLLFLLMLVLACMYFFYLISLISGRNARDSVTAVERSNHVLILGEPEDKNFLQSIYEGAKSLEEAYDCVVELYVPKSILDSNSAGEGQGLQTLFDYASFVHPDGIIACVSAQDSAVSYPENRLGKPVPIVTLSQYNAEIPQISYIGTNYSEVGRKIAVESSKFLAEKGRIAIINMQEDSSPNYSTLMNSLSNTLASYSDIESFVLDFGHSGTTKNFSSDIKKMIVSENADLLVCLTTEDTIRIAQLISELQKDGKIGLIGFGNGEILETYLAKGTVSELLFIDSEKIGHTAIKELFEYMKNGYANSYIAADLSVRKAVTK